MKRWITIWIFFNLTGLFLGAQDPYLSGIARLDEKDYLNAGELFTRALDKDGDKPDLYLKLAETCLQSGNFLETIELARKANILEKGKGDYMIARASAMSGQAAEAMIFLEKHMKSPFRLPRHEILLDPAFTGIEKTESWRTFWKHTWYTEEENLEFEVAYLRRSGDYIEALEKIEEGLSTQPRWDELYAEKGQTLFLMGNKQDALRAFSKAIEISPGSTDYYLGRGRTYVELGKYQEGIRDLEHVLRARPEMLNLYKEISLAYMADSKYQGATEYIQEYLLYYPASAEAHFIHGNIHFEAGQFLKALNSFNRCLDLDTSKAKYFAARGNAFMNTDTWSYALKDFSMALDLDPFNPETWYHKGMCRLKLQDREGARSDFQTAARYGSSEAAEILERMNR